MEALIWTPQERPEFLGYTPNRRAWNGPGPARLPLDAFVAAGRRRDAHRDRRCNHKRVPPRPAADGRFAAQIRTLPSQLR